MNCSLLQNKVALLDNDPNMSDIEAKIFASVKEVVTLESLQAEQGDMNINLCEQGSNLLDQVIAEVKTKPQQSLADYQSLILQDLQSKITSHNNSFVDSTSEEPADIFKLSVSDSQGTNIPLSSHLYQGKVVVFVFWATWCGPCLMKIPELNKLATQYPEQVSVVSIALQTPEAFEEGVTKLEERGVELPSYPIYFDPDKDTYKAVQPQQEKVSIPYTAYYTPNGEFAGEKKGMSFSFVPAGASGEDVNTPSPELTLEIEALLQDL
ncbi:TlpA family protein disulfide reductase [bacterium]|nr:TlpA family protein disulfide reductase [bacterium]